jgi:LmbE family N-acetylglucosaminyl deacetylase
MMGNATMQIELSPKEGLRILCLGAHSDDIESGCGGTILRLIEKRQLASIYWVVFSGDKQRASEAVASAKSFLSGLKKKKIEVFDFRDGYFPYLGAGIKDCFEKIKINYEPNLIFTHFRHDLHQDHRLISDLTWNTFRRHLILEYEILKYDGDLGSPNLFFPLGETTCSKKIAFLKKHFPSQGKKHWFSEDAFLSLLRLRGIEANSPSGYAEAFYARKMAVSD